MLRIQAICTSSRLDVTRVSSTRCYSSYLREFTDAINTHGCVFGPLQNCMVVDRKEQKALKALCLASRPLPNAAQTIVLLNIIKGGPSSR